MQKNTFNLMWIYFILLKFCFREANFHYVYVMANIKMPPKKHTAQRWALGRCYSWLAVRRWNLVSSGSLGCGRMCLPPLLLPAFLWFHASGQEQHLLPRTSVLLLLCLHLLNLDWKFWTVNQNKTLLLNVAGVGCCVSNWKEAKRIWNMNYRACKSLSIQPLT